MEPAAETAAMPPKPRRYVREYLETILVAILIVLFGTTFIVQNSVIPSASMEQTLLIGVEQEGVGHPSGAADTSPDLVELR